MLKYVADVRTLYFCALCLMSYVLQWRYRHTPDESYIVFCVLETVTSLQSFQQAVSVHNFCHVKSFTNERFNRAFAVLLTLLSGAPSSLFVPGHVETHHRAPESEIDATRTTQVSYTHKWMNLLFFFPTVLPRIIKNDWKYMDTQRKKCSALYKQYVLEHVVFNVTLFLLMVADWQKMLCVYFMPTLFGKGMIVTLNLLQHGGCDTTTKYNGARNFTGSVLNFFFFENGFHQVHHMYPGLHWSCVRKKHDEMRHHIHPELLQDNIVRFIWKTYFVLPCSTKTKFP
jgi:fatty acid desaturase